MAHSSPGDNGSSVSFGAVPAPGSPPGTLPRGIRREAPRGNPASRGWRGWAAGWDSWRHPAGARSENDGEVQDIFSPRSVSLCKKCCSHSRLRQGAVPEEKRCLRDLDRVLLCALMQETKDWEHNTAVVKGDGESG